jgi:RNA polymerase sigma factor (sigma-70 family)
MEKTQFDSLDFYVSLAKKTISKFGPKFYNGLSVEMLKNEEAISDVATALMYADWRFDENRQGKSGQKKTLYSYRNQCAIWAIKTYITSKYKKRKDYSMDFDNDNDQTMNTLIADIRQKQPVDILLENEQTEELSKSIETLLDNNILSSKQKQQIRMYYFEDATLSTIGKKFGVSREAIRQNIKRGLDLIKSYDKNNN